MTSTDPFPLPFLVAQARRHPAWQPVDLYKLLHQATRGSEHAAPGRGAAASWLERELREMGPGPEEPIVDLIRADGRIARAHLRPWVAAGLDPAVLLEAFLSTAAAWQEIPGELPAGLERAAASATQLGLAPGAVAELARSMKDQGYPARHHSTEYARRYRPAYRVVATRFLPAGLGAVSPR
jgi:hypothetical protein